MVWHSYTIYKRPLSVRAQYSRLCPISGSFRYNSSLVTWTVICLTAAKFKPLVFSVMGFALSNGANIFIIMILYDLCLLPASWLIKSKSSQSQSYIATDGRSISKSWCRAPSGAHDQIFITLWILWSVFLGRPLWREGGSVFCIYCWPSPA
jgi:hypothetical protein